jgi:hypothetical protein
MLPLLAAVFFVLVSIDAVHTYRRMKLFGLFAESNALIRKLCDKFGFKVGIVLGMFVPAAVWTALFCVTHFQVGMALLVGFRARLCFIQPQSLKYETQIRELHAKMLKEHGLDSGASKKDQTLPLGRSTPDKCLEAGAPPPFINSDDSKK